MNKRGLTLIELTIAMVIGGIVFFALTCQFVTEATFRKMINDQIAATDDASFVMHHMTRVLRYAKPSTVSTALPPDSVYATIITATIGHAAAHPAVNCDNLPEFTADTEVIYGLKIIDNTNTFEYKRGADAPVIISNRITNFASTWVNPILSIQLTAQQGNRSSSLNTKVRLLGT